VDWTDASDAAEREAQFALIAEQLAYTDMDIRVGKDGRCVGVEFPDRPKVH
jgi:hypothetical protein